LVMSEDNRSLILIVDDNTYNIQVLGNILRENDYRTAVAQDGFEALNFLEKKMPDLVLLDIMMPQMDGYEVCERIKKDPDKTELPIIFISVHTDTAEKVKAFRAGAVDYITKPFQQEEILARIRVQLQLQETKEELRRANQDLEKRVQERTAELSEANQKLEQTNTALNVLLEKKDENKKKLEENLIFNVKQLIQPSLEKLKDTELSGSQKHYLDLIEGQIEEVISPLNRNLSGKYSLTSTEMQMLELIKQGKMTKEIADMLGVSTRTVDSHRHNIRKKLEIDNKNVNLRTYLLAMDSEEQGLNNSRE